MEIEICFDAGGILDVHQTIQFDPLFSDEMELTPEKAVEMFNKGELLTSLYSKTVYFTRTFKEVAIVTEISIDHDLEFSDFALQ